MELGGLRPKRATVEATKGLRHPVPAGVWLKGGRSPVGLADEAKWPIHLAAGDGLALRRHNNVIVAAGLQSPRSQAASTDLKPTASARRVFILALPAAANC